MQIAHCKFIKVNVLYLAGDAKLAWSVMQLFVYNYLIVTFVYNIC